MGHDLHRPHGADPSLLTLQNQPVSTLVPRAAMILTIVLIGLFIFRFWIMESWLLKKMYGTKYTSLDETMRRTFVNHHVAGITKFTLLIVAIYPFIAVALVGKKLHTPWVKGSKVTLGDVLVVCSEMFTGMYVFELFYRQKISPISALHHIGAITIAQFALTLSMEWEHRTDATIEFVICFVWGAFDVIAEFWPHVAMIFYRTKHDNHHFLLWVFRAAVAVELIGTLTETIVVLWLFFKLWHRWSLTFKILTPVLHCLFTLAQLWGAYVLNQLAQRQAQLLRDEKSKGDEEQKAASTTTPKPNSSKSTPASILKSLGQKLRIS